MSAKRKRKPTRRNPRLNPTDKRELARARRLARQFHGPAGEGQVVELSAKERKLSRYAVVAGELEDYSYSPDAKASKRGGYRYRHESGDRGPLRKRGKRKPLLAVDVRTKRPIIVSAGSGVKFQGDRGFVG